MKKTLIIWAVAILTITAWFASYLWSFWNNNFELTWNFQPWQLLLADDLNHVQDTINKMVWAYDSDWDIKLNKVKGLDTEINRIWVNETWIADNATNIWNNTTNIWNNTTNIWNNTTDIWNNTINKVDKSDIYDASWIVKASKLPFKKGQLVGNWTSVLLDNSYTNSTTNYFDISWLYDWTIDRTAENVKDWVCFWPNSWICWKLQSMTEEQQSILDKAALIKNAWSVWFIRDEPDWRYMDPWNKSVFTLWWPRYWDWTHLDYSRYWYHRNCPDYVNKRYIVKTSSWSKKIVILTPYQTDGHAGLRIKKWTLWIRVTIKNSLSLTDNSFSYSMFLDSDYIAASRWTTVWVTEFRFNSSTNTWYVKLNTWTRFSFNIFWWWWVQSYTKNYKVSASSVSWDVITQDTNVWFSWTWKSHWKDWSYYWLLEYKDKACQYFMYTKF